MPKKTIVQANTSSTKCKCIIAKQKNSNNVYIYTIIMAIVSINTRVYIHVYYRYIIASILFLPNILTCLPYTSMHTISAYYRNMPTI